MRCPKCGFISFDQLSKCVKCGKDYSGIAQLVRGTAFSVTAPLFLKIQDVNEAKAYGEDIRISDEVIEDFEVQDPDLEILFDDQETVADAETSSLQMETGDDAGLGDGMELSLETGKDEDGEIAIDLSQFQNDLEGPVVGGAVAALGSQGRIGRELPEELADISDLAAPPRQTASPVTEQAADEFDFSLDLDMDDLENGPTSADSTAKVAPAAAKQADDELHISLDLGLEELKDLPGPADSAAKVAPAVAKQADDELDFSLDLGLEELKDLPDSADSAAKVAPAAAKQADDELDFSLDLGLEELKDLPGSADSTAKVASAAAKQADDELDFSLDLGLEELKDLPDSADSTSKVAPAAAKQAEDELDFSLDLGLEELKDLPDSADRQAPPAGDIDLDGFDLPSSTKPKREGKKGVDDESDLDLNLDLEIDLGRLTLDKD